MNTIQQNLLQALKCEGFEGRLVSIRRLCELEREIKALYDAELLDKEFYESNLTHFKYDYSKVLPDARSILITAMPQPQTMLLFNWKKELQKAVIPSTYLADEARRQVMSITQNVLTPLRFSFARFSAIPLKLLAAKSGLSFYGRNNITYIPGMGSCYALFALVTNLLPEEEHWEEPKRMTECEDCSICIKMCPAGCIQADRRLIHAERCLTHFNESEQDFPDWIDKSWHNALVGCTKCQEACPMNRGCLKVTELPDAFDEDEIDMFLTEIKFNALPEKTKETLKKLDLDYAYTNGSMTRNLRVLIN